MISFCRDILRGDKAAAVDTRVIASIAELAQSASKKINVQVARDVRLSDLYADDNFIFLGSPRSNLWTTLFNDRLDFRFVFDDESHQEIIRNVHPLPGEPSSYVPTAKGWATGQSFATISFVQNPGKDGQVLILAGANGEGTAAAGELVTNGPRLSAALQGCGIPPRDQSGIFSSCCGLTQWPDPQAMLTYSRATSCPAARRVLGRSHPAGTAEVKASMALHHKLANLFGRQ